MANYLEEIYKGFAIDKPDIFLPWSASKDAILSLDKNFKKINKNYFILVVELYNLPFIEKIGVHFENNKFSVLELICKKYSKNIHDSFFDHQVILEKIFGKPISCFPGFSCITKASSNDIIKKWRFNDVTLIHKLWDRFGTEERLEFFKS